MFCNFIKKVESVADSGCKHSFALSTRAGSVFHQWHFHPSGKTSWNVKSVLSWKKKSLWPKKAANFGWAENCKLFLSSEKYSVRSMLYIPRSYVNSVLQGLHPVWKQRLMIKNCSTRILQQRAHFTKLSTNTWGNPSAISWSSLSEWKWSKTDECKRHIDTSPHPLRHGKHSRMI